MLKKLKRVFEIIFFLNAQLSYVQRLVDKYYEYKKDGVLTYEEMESLFVELVKILKQIFPDLESKL